MILRLRTCTLDLDGPLVMGILNVTPDSFSDGGLYFDVDTAIHRGMQMVDEGASILDVGGESTRPGAAAVTAASETVRVVPVIEALARLTSVPLSIDTRKPEVMEAAIAAGASMINDVGALQAPGALAVAARSGAAICLMHMQGEPVTMQAQPQYGDVVAEVSQFLADRVAACEAAGIDRDRLILDPGIGFGKRLEHNLALLAHLGELGPPDLPLLIGVSRKSVFGPLIGREVGDRLAGGLAVATAAVLAGVRLVRTHDVASTVDAVKVAKALSQAGFNAAGRRR